MSQKSIFYGNMNGLADKINVKSNQTSKSTVVGLNTKAESINPLVPQTSKNITPTNAQQTITPDNGYNGITNATVEAVVTNLSASIVKSGEVVKIGTTSDDDSVLTLTGEYGGTNPTYLLNDEDSVSTFYFNTESDPDSFLSNLTYDPNTGACSFGVGYFYAVDLNSISPEYYGEYAIVWNDGTVVPIYSTVAVPSFGVTSAGWQVTSYTPSSSVTISMASMLPAFKNIVNYVVAQEEITFGIKKESISVSSNGVYVPTNGIVYSSVSVNVAGDQPQLNAPSSISFSQMNLRITDTTSNGGFTVGFKVFANGVEIPNSTPSIPYTVAKSGTTTTYNMSSYTDSSYPVPVVVKSVGTKFLDSNASNTADFYKYFTVNMYDDDATTLLKTQIVAYGSMPTYTPTKIGYSFDHWEDSNGNIVTAITSDTNLYATYTVGYYIAAGTYYFKTGLTQNIYTTMNIPLNFTWKRKTQPSVIRNGTALYYYVNFSTPSIYDNTAHDNNYRMATFVSTTWLPENFMYQEDGYYKITVTADTNCTQIQREQFDYFFGAI